MISSSVKSINLNDCSDFEEIIFDVLEFVAKKETCGVAILF